MPSASRVLLAPPAAWDEARLMEAARALPPSAGPLRAGDELAGLVVVGVEPAPGAAPGDATVFHVAPRPRAPWAPLVDVAVLLDVSESMGLPWSADLTRAEAARESLDSFLSRGGSGVGRVAVFTFAREAHLMAGPAERGGFTAFEAPPPAGAARVGAALDTALTYFAANERPDRVQAVLLLTDGPGEPRGTRAAAERAARLGVPVHALVFAPALDPLFEEVARRTNGSAQVATLPLVLDFVHQPGSDAT